MPLFVLDFSDANLRIVGRHVARTSAMLASFPGSSAWAERKEPGTHCLRMLSSPRISGNLEISVKSAPLHQPPQGMPTSPA